MTSYLSENDAENLQNGDFRRAEIGYRGQFFFFIFHALSFWLNFFSTGVSL